MYTIRQKTKLITDKNIKLITTSLMQKPTPDILTDFKFNEEETKMLRFPTELKPKSCFYKKQRIQCAVPFMCKKFAHNLYQNQCKSSIFKRVAKIRTSKATYKH